VPAEGGDQSRLDSRLRDEPHEIVGKLVEARAPGLDIQRFGEMRHGEIMAVAWLSP
jgi:hypothetical protein